MTTTDITATATISPINPSLIPNHIREDIGRVGLEAVLDYYKDPENERRFQAWLVEYRKRQAMEGPQPAEGGTT